MDDGEEITLVTRKPCFDLPTACPDCLPVYIYLKLAQLKFRLAINSTFPDSDQIPYVEAGEYVAYNNEKGGVIERLKQENIVNLDAEFHSLSEWVSMKAMIGFGSWLSQALTFELWLGTDGTNARQIYYSDLPWPIGKFLFLKKTYTVKRQLGITQDNVEQGKKQINKRATELYGAISTKLGQQKFLFGDRPSSLDAILLAHVLFALQALPESSVLRTKLLEFDNLVRYAEKLKTEFVDSVSSSPSQHLHSFASASRKGGSSWGSKPKSKPKREKTEQEKIFKKRGRYFLAAQLVATLAFLAFVIAPGPEADVEDGEGFGYE